MADAQSAGARTTSASRFLFRHIPSHSTGSNVPATRPESGASTRRPPSLGPTHDRSGRRRCRLARPVAAATAPPAAPRRAVAALAALAIAPGQSRSEQGSACSQPEAQRRSISPLALRERRAWRRRLSTRRASRSTCRPPRSRTRLRRFRSPLPGRRSFRRTRANRPSHVTLDPTALIAAAPRVHAVLSSGQNRLSSLLAGSRFSRPRRLSRPRPNARRRAFLDLDITEAVGNRHGARTPRRSQSRGRACSRSRRRGRSNRRLRQRRFLRSSQRNPWPRRALLCRASPSPSCPERRRARISRASRSPPHRLRLLRLPRRRHLRRRRHRPPPRLLRRRRVPRPRRRLR